MRELTDMGRVIVEVLGAIVELLGGMLTNAPVRDKPLSPRARQVVFALIGVSIIIGAWLFIGR
jgi:predicted acyltransferase